MNNKKPIQNKMRYNSLVEYMKIQNNGRENR